MERSRVFSGFFGVILLLSLLAWIEYASLQGVFGYLSYLLLGITLVFPWLIPFIGIPLGIVDMFGLWNFRMYDVLLNLSHLSRSWLTLTYYWIMVFSSVLFQIILDFIIVRYLINRKNKEPRIMQNIAFINCVIIDGNLDSDVVKDGYLVVEEGKIAGLGRMDAYEKRPGLDEIDLQGKYVLPGLINAHCHLAASGKPSNIWNLPDNIVKMLRRLLDLKIVKAIVYLSMKKNALTALNSGVTTVRSMGDLDFMDVKLRKETESGRFLGPRLIVAGKTLCATGGHGTLLGETADSKVEIRKIIRTNLREEVDCIKIISTGGVMDARRVGEAGRPQMTVEEIEAACFEAHRGGLLVASHCESEKGIEEALDGGVDTIEHGAPISDYALQLFKTNPKSLRGYSAIIPTISAGMGLATLPREITKISEGAYANAKIVVRGSIEGLKRAYMEKVPIGVGTDASVPYNPHYDLWKELKYFIHYTGMSAREAIHYATRMNAEILGIGHITGSLERGKSADLIVVDSNPLENIDTLGHIDKVIVRGILIDQPGFKRIKELDDNPIKKPIDLKDE